MIYSLLVLVCWIIANIVLSWMLAFQPSSFKQTMFGSLFLVIVVFLFQYSMALLADRSPIFFSKLPYFVPSSDVFKCIASFRFFKGASGRLLFLEFLLTSFLLLISYSMASVFKWDFPFLWILTRCVESLSPCHQRKWTPTFPDP